MLVAQSTTISSFQLHIPLLFRYNFHTFRNPRPRILADQACFSMDHLRRLHAQILVKGLAGEPLALSKLLSFCALSGSGDLRYAQKLFDGFPEPNRFMYNTLIRAFSMSDEPQRALSLYRRMLASSGLSPNEFTIPFVLKACATTSGYWETIAVHCQSVKLGIDSRVYVGNALINAYVVSGFFQYARRLFDEMSERTIVSWNTIISGYSKTDFFREAFLLFREMRESSVMADKFTLVSLLSVCSQSSDLDSGRNLHHFIEVSGVKIDQIVRNSLLDMYAKCGDLRSARTVFDRMLNKNVVSWTSMVTGYAKNGLFESAKEFFENTPAKNVVSWNAVISSCIKEGRFKEALDLFREMQRSETDPDETTLVCALSACSQIGDLAAGEEIHKHVSNSSPLSATLSNALIDMYAKCGALETASRLFVAAPQKNRVSWNVMISGLALHGHGAEAIARFKEMQAHGIHPDGVTFVGLILACGHGGHVRSGWGYFRQMSEVYGITPELEHYACAVDLLGRAGLLGQAVGLIAEMPMRPDVVVWGALLGACRIHSSVGIAKQVLKQVLELGLMSSGVLVLTCNLFGEAGRWDDVERLRRMMKDSGVVKSRAVSFVEVDGCVCEFMADDKRHPNSVPIRALLHQFTRHSKPLVDNWDSVH